MTKIANQAFLRTGLTSIAFPNSISTIPAGVCYNCKHLKSIDLPNSVTSIEASAFAACPNLISVTIPDSVTQIYEDAFNDCSNLQYVAAPATIVNNPGDIFKNCPRLLPTNIVVSTADTRLRVLRRQYFHPSTHSQSSQEQRQFVLNVMLIGSRTQTTHSSISSIPNEVLVLILMQLRIPDMGAFDKVADADADDVW